MAITAEAHAHQAESSWAKAETLRNLAEQARAELGECYEADVLDQAANDYQNNGDDRAQLAIALGYDPGQNDQDKEKPLPATAPPCSVVRDAFIAGTGAMQPTPGFTPADPTQAAQAFRLWATDQFAGTIIVDEARDTLTRNLGEHAAADEFDLDCDRGAVRWRYVSDRPPGWHETPMAYGVRRVADIILDGAS